MSLAFQAPQFLWALLALPLVVLLHFLRTRRRSRLVSALFLWRKATEAAALKRNFSATWLLLLQLLFVALAALALARPALSFEGPPDRVIVVDASASMAARDADGVRIDKAREVAGSLLADGRVAVIRAGLDAQVIAPLDSPAGAARSALANLQAGDRSAQLDRALELARSLSPEGEVHLLSDEAREGAGFTLHNVAGEAINYGISTFESGIGQVYLAVTSNDPRPQQLELRVLAAGSEVARTSVLVPGEGQGNVTFPIDQEAGFLQAVLEVPDSDALALDDIAYAGRQALDVVVGESNPALLRALEAIPGLNVRVSPSPLTVAGDLRVLSGVDPDSLPEGDVLLFDGPFADPEFRQVRDWAQGDALLRFVDLRDVIVGLAPDSGESESPAGTSDGQAATTDFVGRTGAANDDWEVLARSQTLEPVISRRRNGNGTVVRVHFHPSQTDMVLRPAFPTFIANVVTGFSGEVALPLGSTLPEGTLLDGEEMERALIPGIYRVNGREVAVSLLSAGETRLPGPVAATTTAEPAPPATTQANRALWLVLLIVALALLSVEWWGWARGGRGWLRG